MADAAHVYLTKEEYLAGHRSILRIEAENVEKQEPGYLEIQLEIASRRVDDYICKRYTVPLAPPFPSVVKRWVGNFVSYQVYLQRGGNSQRGEAHDKRMDRLESDTVAELLHAADGQNSLLEIQIGPRSDETGVTKGGLIFASTTNPFELSRQQYRRAQREGSLRRL